MNGSILAIVPVFGDESHLAQVITSAQEGGLDALVVNDGNPAGLKERLRGVDVEVIDLGVNHGVGVATLTGLRAAVARGYSGALAIDADGAHDPVSMRLVSSEATRNLDRLVVCDRFSRASRRYVPDSKLAANRFAAAVFEEATGQVRSDVCCGLRYYPGEWARTGWTPASFDFIYETLAQAESGEGTQTIATWVNYPSPGPWLTQDRELRDFVNWSIRAGIPRDKAQTLRLLIDADANPIVRVHAAKQTFALRAVPAMSSWLITDETPRASELTQAPHPRLAVGIIPDGGGRLARREGIELSEAYRSAADLLMALIRSHSRVVESWGVYWLSEANLAREPAEINAACETARHFALVARTAGLRPVVFGNTERLPPPFGRWAYDTNLASSLQGTGSLVVLAMAYSPDWEKRYSSEPQPWRLGLSPSILEAVEHLRFSIVLRSGAANTLSRFLPRACEWASLYFDERLFNEIDLDEWLAQAIDERARARFGV